MRQSCARTVHQTPKRLTPIWSDPTPEPVRTGAAPFAGAPIHRLSINAETDSQSGVMLVGNRFRTRRLQSRLEAWEGYELRCIAADSLVDARRYIATGRVDAVLYVAPLEDSFESLNLEGAVSALRKQTPSGLDIVHVALVPESFGQERVRDLYGKGVRAVFAWPQDISPLPGLVRQMLASQAAEPRSEPESLAYAVRARVRRFGRMFAVDTVGSFARVTGHVESMWAKLALRRHARQTPGIEQVDVAGVEFDSITQGDAATDEGVRTLLDTSKAVDARTTGASVHNGNVIRMGTSNLDE